MIVVMPMAGRGSRFKNEGYTTPKPFIQVAGMPMFLWGLKSLEPIKESIQKVILVVLKLDAEKNKLDDFLHQIPWEVEVIEIDEVTEGQLCTVLMARSFFEQSDEEVLVIPSDTYIQHDDLVFDAQAHGAISVSKQEGEHWSFAVFNDEMIVSDVAEKVRISDYASTGLYYFKSGQLLCNLADGMIKNKEKTRGEYYIMPLYKKYLEKGLNIMAIEATEMHDLGTPQAKHTFEQSLKL